MVKEITYPPFGSCEKEDFIWEYRRRGVSPGRLYRCDMLVLTLSA